LRDKTMEVLGDAVADRALITDRTVEGMII
jgi:hypothetical protein